MSVYFENGDAIEGKRIVCEFKKIGKVNLFPATHMHRGSRVTLDDALCNYETLKILRVLAPLLFSKSSFAPHVNPPFAD